MNFPSTAWTTKQDMSDPACNNHTGLTKQFWVFRSDD